jgi:GNAT superfamily N-acetyltransferase
MLNIRPATAADSATVASLVRELADYEKLLHEARATAADFERELTAEHPVIRVLIAEWNGEPAGFALYFFNFSTFVGRPGLYLEDLFVRPALRSHGIGRARARLRTHGMGRARLERAGAAVLPVARRPPDDGVDSPSPDARRDRQAGG